MSPIRPTAGVEAHRLSATRLWGIVFLFLLFASYAIWKSERFQNLIQGVSQSRLTQALGRPVTFRTVELRVFPPSVRLADVRVGNHPRLSGALLSAEEVSIGGGVSLVGQELRLGRIRALRPHFSLVQFPDGSWNLPPGLTKPGKPGQGGLSLKIGSILVQEGVFEFDGRKMKFSGRLEDFAAELTSLAGGRYRGGMLARRATIRVAGSEPIVGQVSTRFLIDPKRGLTFDDLSLEGPVGRLQATGALEGFVRPNAVFAATADLSIEEVERVFHVNLGFAGRARVGARLEIPWAGGFRLAGHLDSARVRADPFTLEDLAATITANPESLLAQIERAGYAGGRAAGTLRIGNLAGDAQPMTLALEAQGLSVERFFGDIGLAGTGLSGSAAVTLALHWGQGGIQRADGGGSLRVAAGRAESLVRGRFGIPTAGGGGFSVVRGRIRFDGAAFHFAQSSIDVTGGFDIGRWQPDFDFRLRSRDLSEVDRLFQNFLAAGGSKPDALGLGGSGEIFGHLGGRWAQPEANVRVTAEDARYGGVPFGSVRGSVEMREGAFFFRPLRIYDGGATLSLEGMARYEKTPGVPRFNLSVSANRYPLSRLLQYLDLRFPVEGLVTGSFPVQGTPEALTGGGPVELSDATVWGQKFSKITGRVLFTPGRLALEDLRASIGPGVIGGRGALSIRDRTFEARLAGDKIPIEAVDALASASKEATGKLSFTLSGGGSLDRPDLQATATVSDATFFGHALPDGGEPRLEATVAAGVLDATAGVSERWTARAQGDLFGQPARIEVSLDATDLNAFLLMTPLALPYGRSGTVAVHGTLILPAKAGDLPTGTFTVTRARLDLPDRPGVLATSGAVQISLADGRLTFDDFQAIGEGTALKAGGSINLGEKSSPMNLKLSGTLDPALLALQFPDVGLTGRLALDLRAAGTLSQPALSGTARIENGRYRLTSLSQIVDDIEANVTFQGARADLEGRAKFGGGEVYASGSLRVERLALQDFRVSIQARRVALHYPQDLRLLADADLVATGNGRRNDLRGEVTLLRGTYSKDFEVTLSDLLARSRPAGAIVAREAWKERTALDVRIVSSAALEVRNNLARLTATVDLLARGTVADPTVTGQIVLDEGGRITFRNVRYDIESGTVTFASTRGFAPILDIHARAEVRGYDLVVSLVGTWPRIQTSFSSDPPLPDEQIFSLLLTGTAPSGRTTATAADSTSESIVSAGASLAAGAAASTITRPTQRFFKLDRFEIDPVFSGGQLSDIRSTIGKQIAPNVLATFSQSLDTSKPPVYGVEWQITNTIVLRARHDENGVYLVDVRRRTRY
ncbi:MAG TPA: translocation/assembly module TamB domain-containing protein [Thermoanaerobaculia bacterium]|nr:translocation/assembly module TamB domain-containing protein [Thermoanaerobaculia bacterium]